MSIETIIEELKKSNANPVLLSLLQGHLNNLETKVSTLETNLHKKTLESQKYFQMFLDMRDGRFGRRSEKFEIFATDSLFNEAEFGVTDDPKLHEGHSETVEVVTHKRAKRGRKPLPSDLPRETIIHDLEESEKVCACGHDLVKIGEEKSEKLSIVPQTIKVIEHICNKYACPYCKGDEREEAGKIVHTASLPAQLIPKSLLTPELFSYVLCSKFVDHIPLYRQEQMFLRLNLEITRQTLSNWILGVYRLHLNLFSFWEEEIRSGPLIGIDETPVQVLRENGKLNTTKSYVWLFLGGSPARPFYHYLYKQTRSASFIPEYLNDYQGVIQTDGYESYKTHLKANPKLQLVACMAHVRRKFYKLWKRNKDEKAQEIVQIIQHLYRIEKEIRAKNLLLDGELEEIVRIRQEKARPIFEDLKATLERMVISISPDLELHKVIRYALKQIDGIALYLTNAFVSIDNNLVENAIRPLAIGRKNWLFCGSPTGADASMFFYSLLETIKKNGREPYVTILDFFRELPFCNTSDDTKRLFYKVMGWG